MATADARTAWFDPRPIAESTNWVTIALAGVMLAVQAIALLLALSSTAELQTIRASSPAEMQSVNYAGYLLAVMAIEGVLLVAVIHFYKWLPKRLRKVIKYTLAGSIVLGVGGLTYLLGGIALTIGFYAVWIGSYYAIRWLSLELVLMNTVYALLFAGIGTMLGTMLGIKVILAFIVGLAILDLIEVKTGWIMYLIRKTASVGFVPAIIISSKLRPDFEEFTLDPKEERPDWAVAILGGGDLAIPAVFLTAAFLEFGGRFPTLGILLGAVVVVVITDHEMKTAEDTQPALVFIIPCVLVGYVVTGLLAGLTPLELLGVA